MIESLLFRTTPPNASSQVVVVMSMDEYTRLVAKSRIKDEYEVKEEIYYGSSLHFPYIHFYTKDQVVKAMNNDLNELRVQNNKLRHENQELKKKRSLFSRIFK